MPIHCNAKKDDISKTVLMPGDPLRAKYIAENFLENAKLVNTVRNMFAYATRFDKTVDDAVKSCEKALKNALK